MKNRALLLFSLIFLNTSLYAQEENQYTLLLDSVISASRETSYYSSSVNWDSLSTEMHALVNDPKDMNDLTPAFTVMLNTLRDHHGRIMSTKDYSNVAYFNDWENARYSDEREFLSEHWGIVNNLDARFEYALLPGNIGYLKIVGVGGNVDGQLEAERIRAAVSELSKNNVEEWIIDLRFNSGGNVNVMLAGIAPLLDTKTVASVIDESNQVQLTAEVKKGNFWYADYNAFKLKKGPKIKKANIAVLTSRWTASSGELVAVAFKGQENVRFFGEKTGGYTTNTGWNNFNNEIVLVIATGVFCDRNGLSYDEFVPVDEEVEFKIESDRSKDEAIIEASKWLLHTYGN